jgi:hypothetical protein
MDIREVYQSIMSELRSLPGAIAEAERKEAAIVEAAGGWSAMGKNEGERGMQLVSMMAQAGNQTVNETRKRFDSAVAQANLTGNMLRYLASPAVAQANLIDALTQHYATPAVSVTDLDIETTPEQITASANGNGNADPATMSMFGL